MDADEACKDLGITPHSLRFTSTVSLNIVGKLLNLLIIIHGGLYRWRGNSFPFFISETKRDFD